MYPRAAAPKQKSMDREQLGFPLKLPRQLTAKPTPLFPSAPYRSTPKLSADPRKPALNASRNPQTLHLHSNDSFGGQNYKRLKALVSPERRETNLSRRETHPEGSYGEIRVSTHERLKSPNVLNRSKADPLARIRTEASERSPVHGYPTSGDRRVPLYSPSGDSGFHTRFVQQVFPAAHLPEPPSEDTHKKPTKTKQQTEAIHEISSSGSEEAVHLQGPYSPVGSGLHPTPLPYSLQTGGTPGYTGTYQSLQPRGSGAPDIRPAEGPNVRMTASFNVMTPDCIEEYEAQVDRAVNKLRKISSASASSFNRQQLAFILHSLGWVDELDEDFNARQPEDATFLTILFTAMKSRSGLIKLRTLKKSLAMLHALQDARIVTRDSRKPTIKSPKAQKTSLSNRQLSPNILSSAQSNDLHKARSLEDNKTELRVDSRGRVTPPSLEPAGNLTIEEIFNERQPSDRDIHFSFKKAAHGHHESNVSELPAAHDLHASSGLNLNGLLEHQSLLLESKDPSRFAKALIERSQQKANGSAEDSAKKQFGVRLLGKLGGRSSEGGVSTGLRELLSPDSFAKRQPEERDANRGRFLFSNTILCGGKSHMVKVYEGDDLTEQAKRFAGEHGADLDKCLATFGRIEAQRESFVKNFQIAE